MPPEPPSLAAAPAPIPAEFQAQSEEALRDYLQACELTGVEGLEIDIAPEHSGRADGFVANRLGDGKKPALFYLPGLHSDDLVFWPNHAALAERFTLYGVRYRTEGAPTPERYAADVLETMDLAGVERAHLVGESMGSIPAQWLAVRHPGRVETLALTGGFARPPDAARMFVAKTAATLVPGFVLRWMVRTLFYPGLKLCGFDGERFSPELVHAYAALRGPVQIRALRRRLKMIGEWDFHGELPGIGQPFLYVHGSRDLTVPARREARRYAERVPGAKIVRLDGASHAVLVTRPKECRDAIASHALGL